MAQILSAAINGFFLYDGIKALIPSPNSKLATQVQISIGSTGVHGNSDLMGGNIPNIQLWTESGDLIGSAPGDSKKVSGPGSTIPISVNPNKGMENEKASYIAVSAGGNDGICISAISVAYPDGSAPLVWTGDLASNCTADWSPQIIDTGTGHQKSNCVWIDGDYSNGLKYQGLGLHITDFIPKAAIVDQFNKNNDLLCKAPARQNFYPQLKRDDWTLYFQPPLEFNSDGTDKDPTKVINQGVDLNPELLHPGSRRIVRKRSSSTNNRVMARAQGNDELGNFLNGTIIRSNSSSHSAEMICKSPGSFSPDFVSYHEQLFCDMTTRQLWPLCSTKTTVQCFNTQSNSLELHSAIGGISNIVNTTGKSYTSVADWE